MAWFPTSPFPGKEGIRIGRSEGVDFLLPIGGGSVIDTAKGIGYGIANDFEIEDLLYGRVKTDKNLPIGVILTIAAAGSEMSSSMVLTIEDGMMKRSYGHDCSRPRSRDVLAGNVQRTVRQVNRGHAGILDHVRRRNADAARAAAQIENTR